MRTTTKTWIRSAFLFPVLLVSACGGGGSGPSPATPPSQGNSPPPATYKIGGSVTGLSGSGLTLALNGAGNVSVAGNGTFTFSTSLAGGDSYTVTVVAQPTSPSQVCTIANGTGSVAASDVSTVSVSCGFVGRFAYVSGTAGITAYSINHATGLLSSLPGSPFTVAVNSTNYVVLHPNGKFVYAVDPGYISINGIVNGALAVYSIDSNTGVPSATAGSPFSVAASPFMLAFHPSGKFAFAPNWQAYGGVAVFAIDTGTGAPTQIAGSPFACSAPTNSIANPISVAVSPNGAFLYVGTQAGGFIGGLICGYSIDASTGALTPVPGSPYVTTQSLFATSLTLDASGKFLYAAGPGSFGAFSVDASTGALTTLASPSELTSSNSETVVADPSGKFLYVTDTAVGSGSQIFGYSIDPASGLLTAIAGSPFASAEYPYSITFDPSEDLAYVALSHSGEISVYSVNKTSGALAPLGTPISNGANTDPRSIAVLP